MIGGDIHGSANIDILTLELDIITPGMDERGVLDAISLNKSGPPLSPPALAGSFWAGAKTAV